MLEKLDKLSNKIFECLTSTREWTQVAQIRLEFEFGFYQRSNQTFD